MGRKAKIKQQKKQVISNNLESEKSDLDNKNFVKKFEHQGYNFKQIKRSPDLPSQKNEPQI